MKLWVYAVRRLILLIPTLIGLTFLVFALLHVGGNTNFIKDYLDPRVPQSARAQAIAALYAQFHLNDPIWVQYFYWIWAILQGNWGFTSAIQNLPVTTALELFLPNTVFLTICASALTWIVSIPVGVYSAVRRDSILDQGVRVSSFTLYSMPIFLIGFGLLYLALALAPSAAGGWIGPATLSMLIPLPDSWFDHSLAISSPTHILFFDAALHGDWPLVWDTFLHFILPTLTLTFALMAGVVRILRASMLEVLDQDYIRLARAKGAPERVVNYHAKRNALLPTVTTFGFLVASLLGGAVIVEDIFVLHGIGFWTTRALLKGDPGGVMGSTLVFGIILVLANLIIDLLYAFLDPRIRY